MFFAKTPIVSLVILCVAFIAQSSQAVNNDGADDTITTEDSFDTFLSSHSFHGMESTTDEPYSAADVAQIAIMQQERAATLLGRLRSIPTAGRPRLAEFIQTVSNYANNVAADEDELSEVIVELEYITGRVENDNFA